MDKLEPQQPEELVKCIYYDNCDAHIAGEIDCDGDCGMTEQSKAQLAHTMRSLKAQGWVKLPSEDELSLHDHGLRER